MVDKTELDCTLTAYHSSCGLINFDADDDEEEDDDDEEAAPGKGAQE